MAVDYLSTKWLSGADLTDATNLKITWASLGITWVETGGIDPQEDIRNILRGIADEIQAQYDTPAPDDTPTKFTSSESTRYNDSTSEFEEKRGWTFDLTPGATTLASET